MTGQPEHHTVAVVFGGGVGRRMSSSALPKQFLELHGKPIFIHTLEHFERHPRIDAVAVACLPDWIPRLRSDLDRFRLTKVRWVVPGGATGQLSIRAGLLAAASGYDPATTTVLVHDAVRPLISAQLIDSCLTAVDRYGSAVTCSPATETVVLVGAEGDTVREITRRPEIRLARAPQAFNLAALLAAHDGALARGEDDVIDSCSIMRAVGHEVHLVDGPPENIEFCAN